MSHLAIQWLPDWHHQHYKLREDRRGIKQSFFFFFFFVFLFFILKRGMLVGGGGGKGGKTTSASRGPALADWLRAVEKPGEEPTNPERRRGYSQKCTQVVPLSS